MKCTNSELASIVAKIIATPDKYSRILDGVDCERNPEIEETGELTERDVRNWAAGFAAEKEDTKMKVTAYKGFNADMTCTPKDGIRFQYVEGETYEFKKAVLCVEGAHACLEPLDCLKYYAPHESVYHEVELLGEIIRSDHENDSKVCTTKIKIGRRLSLSELALEQARRTSEQVGKSFATGYNGKSVAKGFGGNSVATGFGGSSFATGYNGKSVAMGFGGSSFATGNYGNSVATGFGGNSVATGFGGSSFASGNYGNSFATGDYGKSFATGDYGKSVATGFGGNSFASGNYGKSVATGDDSIAISTGRAGKAKAAKGSAIFIAERGRFDGRGYPLLAVRAAIVDDTIIKADTWYTLKNGEFVEVEDNA